MTHIPHARLVLQDASFVRYKLEHEEQLVEWRLWWVLCIVLLRAVGHVLDKVDGKDTRIKAVAHQFHKRWQTSPEHGIFRDFIEKERNSILKEYSSAVSQGPIPIMAYLQRSDGFDVIRQFMIEENLYRPLHRDQYEGEDGRTVIDEAIAWWTNQLMEIDQALDAQLAGGS